MLFNSYIFIFAFLPIVWSGFFLIGKKSTSLASAWLTAASLAFYSYWSTKYLWLLVLSIGINFVIASSLVHLKERRQTRQTRFLLIIAIVANLGTLAYFKYANFFLSAITAAWGKGEHLNIILPLGISFYTFTQIAFLVDVYTNKVNKFNLLHYSVFITYFPHLIAGPVLHHTAIIPPLQKKATYCVNWANMSAGITLFAIGLFKKVYWADSLAPFVDDIYASVAREWPSGNLPTTYEAWAGALSYTLQIYFDFSGYSDMARGIALLFNINLPINFNSPYKAVSIIDFWRRWHLSLSAFLRDYVYIPLGGNRKGKFRRYQNLLATMLIGGLWHGAGWTFIFWGAIHGVLLAVNHYWTDFSKKYPRLQLPSPLGKILGAALTFIFVVVAWVLFRSASWLDASVMLQAMFKIASKPILFSEVATGHLLVLSNMSGHDLALLIVLGLAWVWLLPVSNDIRYTPKSTLDMVLRASGIVILLCWTINRFGAYSPFLYYQF